MLKRLLVSSLMTLAATSAMAQTSTSSDSGSTSKDDHFYSHYQPYFPPVGTKSSTSTSTIPGQSTYKPYFAPAYSTVKTNTNGYTFGARIVETGTHADLMSRKAEDPNYDPITGNAKYSYQPPPGSYKGNEFFGFDAGCRVIWKWDKIYHRYVKQSGCK